MAGRQGAVGPCLQAHLTREARGQAFWQAGKQTGRLTGGLAMREGKVCVFVCVYVCVCVLGGAKQAVRSMCAGLWQRVGCQLGCSPQEEPRAQLDVHRLWGKRGFRAKQRVSPYVLQGAVA